jgi:hypothetical protein
MHTQESRCDQLVIKYQQETTAKYESVGGVNAVSCGFQVAPVTTAALLPAAINGWYVNPRVTLSVTDQDSAVERMEYRLDNAGSWTPYTGPFQVTGDGAHTLEYRSVDADDNVEGVRTLAFRIDATPPAITGLPVGCTIWPPNGALVPVATIATSDGGSGVTAGALAVQVTASEAPASGDIVIKGGQVLLRAKRTGKGDGNLYTIDASAQDLAGNAARATATCVVPHDQASRN